MAAVLSVLRPPARHQRRLRRGVHLLPGMFTVANLFCGWVSIVSAMRGDYVTAAPFIGTAMVLDMLDGRIARLANATSDFGEQLDSLADVVSFGIAPAILVFAWGLQPLGRLGWAAGFLWVTATAVRLARFNIQAKDDDRRYFLGLPSPAAAGIPAATVFLYPGGLQDVAGAVLVALPLVVVPAALMVSRIRYRSVGALLPGHRRSSLTPVVIAAVIAAIVVQPGIVLVAAAYTYMLSGLIGLLAGRIGRSRRRGGPGAEPSAAADGGP
ncbi:MAG: CDP-diacylglycerol--serine O-phosphatidyltransferase [Acidobacteria bacterium]|nr:CDP-diacylglycerol--serine O-phosphatidyltransferase [Acidobacteriota bacterium]